MHASRISLSFRSVEAKEERGCPGSTGDKKGPPWHLPKVVQVANVRHPRAQALRPAEFPVFSENPAHGYPTPIWTGARAAAMTYHTWPVLGRGARARASPMAFIPVSPRAYGAVWRLGKPRGPDELSRGQFLGI